MQNNNDQGAYETLFDEWHRCYDKGMFLDE